MKCVAFKSLELIWYTTVYSTIFKVNSTSKSMLQAFTVYTISFFCILFQANTHKNRHFPLSCIHGNGFREKNSTKCSILDHPNNEISNIISVASLFSVHFPFIPLNGIRLLYMRIAEALSHKAAPLKLIRRIHPSISMFMCKWAEAVHDYLRQYIFSFVTITLVRSCKTTMKCK